MGLLFKNNAETTLSSGINNSTTTIPVASAAVFPTPDTNNKFFATLDDGTNVETVLVTAISSNDLTVVRAQDNTSAAAFGSGAKIELRLNAKVLEMGTASLTDLDGDTQVLVEEAADEDKIKFKAAGTEVMRIDSTGIGIGGVNPVEKITIDGNIANISGDMIIDCAADIVLDADGGNIEMKDDGLHFYSISRSGDNAIIQSVISDGDVIIQGNDGGSTITALTVDMSAAGSAYFNHRVGVGSTDPTTDGYDYAEDLVIKAGGSTNSDGAGLTIQNVGRRYGVIAFGDSAATNAGEIYYDHTNNAFYLKTNAAERFSLDSSGNAIFTGNVTAYGSISDERLKENIEVIENPIEKIKDLKGVTFNYKKDGSKSTGLIAQDLEKVLPEAVYTSETLVDIKEGEKPEEHLAIHYGNTVGLLVEAIKELEARVKELEDK
nr:hypothetical protein [uncultured Mediterranean phage uvMED]BAR25757.1 hypothetical protein [uncultured Mediterranean phage uvMED]